MAGKSTPAIAAGAGVPLVGSPNTKPLEDVVADTANGFPALASTFAPPVPSNGVSANGLTALIAVACIPCPELNVPLDDAGIAAGAYAGANGSLL